LNIFSIPFGVRELAFTCPDRAVVREIKPRPYPPIPSVTDAVYSVLEHPIGVAPLKNLIRAGNRISVLCDDHTRPTPMRGLLSALLDRLLSCGISRDHIQIFVAYGLHPPMKEEELEARFGNEILSRFPICHHDAHEEKGMAFLGYTAFGTPVYVNRAVLYTDFMIGVGNISLSKEAGYGGGAKILMPGVCGAETIYGSHGKVCRHPNQIGRINGNPIREEIEEVGRMAHLDFIINTILNEKDEICHLVAGDPFAAFREGVRFFDDVYRFPLEEPFDWCLAGSSPYDFEFYQANKAVSAASLGVSDGGTIVLVSPCDKGISAFPYFDEMITSGHDFDYWQEELGKPDSRHKVAGEICLSLRYLMDVRKITIGMVTTGIPKKTVTEMGLKPYSHVEEAITEGLRRYGMNGRVGILPKAPMTLLEVP
jgi:nickel-dependent lactate racemase